VERFLGFSVAGGASTIFFGVFLGGCKRSLGLASWVAAGSGLGSGLDSGLGSGLASGLEAVGATEG